MCLSSANVNCVVFKPDNPNILVSCSWDMTIKVWNITSGACLSTMTGHSGDNPKCLCKHDYPYTVNPECPVIGHVHVTGIAFSGDGQWLIAGSTDGKIRLLDVIGF